MPKEAYGTFGATWPDVALALVEFAREDPWTFVGILAAVGWIVWCLFPRATRTLMEGYRAARRLERRDVQPPERSPPGKQDDD